MLLQDQTQNPGMKSQLHYKLSQTYSDLMVDLAYMSAFSALMLINGQFCRLLRINSVIFRHTFQFE